MLILLKNKAYSLRFLIKRRFYLAVGLLFSLNEGLHKFIVKNSRVTFEN